MIKTPDYATEFATLEKTIEFVARWGGDTHYFRIEALRYESGGYTTHVYLRIPFAMKNAMTVEDGRKIQHENDRYVWVDFPDAPSSHGNSADDALRLQLSLLSDRLKHA
jgi:hypothetical protein